MTPPVMTSIQEPESPVKTIEQREGEISAALTAINVFIKILAIRFFLFLSLVGAFVLSIIATENQTTQSSLVIMLYAAVTVLPLTLLELKNRAGG